MAHKQSRFLVQQKVTVGIVGLFILVVLGYVSTLVVKERLPLGSYIEGEHYTLLEKPRRVRGSKVEILEFFSYACGHCYRFDPQLEDWLEANQDTVEFVRTPIAVNEGWRRLARHYYTMEHLGASESLHQAFFYAVQDRNLNTSSAAHLAEWAGKNGVDNYLKTYESDEVQRRTRAADQLSRRLRIASVPTVVVQGKYVVKPTDTIGLARVLEVMDHLVALEVAPQRAASK